jgi:aryl-alcohol dehydrogenase-like predicted oxidoreductase
MEYRPLGRTGFDISSIGFGAWAIGGTWGEVDDATSKKALHRALERGVNFFDTADVYGDGRSERLLGQLRKETREPIFIATKAGRRVPKHIAAGYTHANLTSFVERSLTNLGVDAIDLLQLHSPPTDVYYMPEAFDALDDLVRQGKLRFYGVSVERVEEALKSLEYPGVQSVQIIFNIFRQRPAHLFFEQAKRKRVGILTRLPLSSGMLTGKMTKATSFSSDDHRAFNREGAAFDKGETFSGVPYETGLEIVEELRSILPAGPTMAQWALRWILMHDAVSAAIPGAKTPQQVDDNMTSADLSPLPEALMGQLRDLYDRRLRPLVHQRW